MGKGEMRNRGTFTSSEVHRGTDKK